MGRFCPGLGAGWAVALSCGFGFGRGDGAMRHNFKVLVARGPPGGLGLRAGRREEVGKQRLRGKWGQLREGLPQVSVELVVQGRRLAFALVLYEALKRLFFHMIIISCQTDSVRIVPTVRTAGRVSSFCTTVQSSL